MRGRAGSFFLNSGQNVRNQAGNSDSLSLEFRVSGVKRIFSGGKSNGRLLAAVSQPWQPCLSVVD